MHNLRSSRPKQCRRSSLPAIFDQVQAEMSKGNQERLSKYMDDANVILECNICRLLFRSLSGYAKHDCNHLQNLRRQLLDGKDNKNTESANEAAANDERNLSNSNEQLATDNDNLSEWWTPTTSRVHTKFNWQRCLTRFASDVKENRRCREMLQSTEESSISAHPLLRRTINLPKLPVTIIEK
ncbi:hypothetical protein GJ496_007625 [Pomphorhynchus laevis]|nr:hypothetical protein GJ496_007625 [Pomphorhynchus laevis]